MIDFKEETWHPLIQEAIQEKHPALWRAYLKGFAQSEDYSLLIVYLQDWLMAKGIGRQAAYATAALVVRDTFQKTN